MIELICEWRDVDDDDLTDIVALISAGENATNLELIEAAGAMALIKASREPDLESGISDKMMEYIGKEVLKIMTEVENNIDIMSKMSKSHLN